MIGRAILLELHGTSAELAMELRTLGEALEWTVEPWGGLRLLDDGWHTVSPGGTVSINAYQTPRTALQAVLQGRAYDLAGRLQP